MLLHTTLTVLPVAASLHRVLPPLLRLRLQMVASFVSQLDEIFGTPDNPRPTTANLVKSHVIDWSKQPWVRGAYT
jgi:hypothetical protein